MDEKEKTMTEPNLQTIYRHDPQIVARKIAGEVILVPVRKHVGEFESIYTLNETAAYTWELIDGQRTASAILESILDEFEIERVQAEADLTELLHNLVEIGALEKL